MKRKMLLHVGEYSTLHESYKILLHYGTMKDQTIYSYSQTPISSFSAITHVSNPDRKDLHLAGYLNNTAPIN